MNDAEDKAVRDDREESSEDRQTLPSAPPISLKRLDCPRKLPESTVSHPLRGITARDRPTEGWGGRLG